MFKKIVFSSVLAVFLCCGAAQLFASRNALTCEEFCYYRLENCWAKGISPSACSNRYVACMADCN